VLLNQNNKQKKHQKMKQIKKNTTVIFTTFLAIVCIGYVVTCQAQRNTWVDKPNQVTIYLKNNSILPKKVTLISYQPGETTNGTSGFVLMPFATRKYTFTLGTKIYLAKQKQVDTVMGGGKLNDAPFLIIKQENDGKKINIFK
jgi:hypothetical protein